ncbi:aminoglycoside phosphotransferase family protein [Streptomyces sp. NPDC001348]
MANAGAVFRRGALVERPAPNHARALHAYLLALEEHGFAAAPTPVRLTADGREQLTFIPGDVAVPPFPDWAMTKAALESVGGLLRRLHDTGAAVAVDARAEWPRDLADPEGGTMLCHNDVCPENVVFRDGRAVALIDFDLAAPGRPLWDVAMTARYWVPILDPGSAADLDCRAHGRGQEADEPCRRPVSCGGGVAGTAAGCCPFHAFQTPTFMLGMRFRL